MKVDWTAIKVEAVTYLDDAHNKGRIHDIRLSGSSHQRRIARRKLARSGIYTIHRRVLDKAGNFINAKDWR